MTLSTSPTMKKFSSFSQAFNQRIENIGNRSIIYFPPKFAPLLTLCLQRHLLIWKSKFCNQTIFPSIGKQQSLRITSFILHNRGIEHTNPKLKIRQEGPMKLYCDNKSTINIAHNPVQHDRTMDRHFIKEKLDSGLICTPYISSSNQLADVLTKGLPTLNFQEITSKLGMENIYSPACGGVLEISKFISLAMYSQEICIFADFSLFITRNR